MDKKPILIPVGRLDRMILLVRGQRVLLDRDLAKLYGVETRVLNQAVRRNRDRFPDDFMFPLDRREIRNISQFVICSSTIKHAKTVFAFTEQGVAMLSSVLKSPRAVQVNIEIMRAFVRLRQALASNRELAEKLAELERTISNHDEQIQAIFEAIRELMNPPEPPRKEIGFHIKEDEVPYRIAAGRHCQKKH
jgi:ORF6N domain-containing protein